MVFPYMPAFGANSSTRALKLKRYQRANWKIYAEEHEGRVAYTLTYPNMTSALGIEGLAVRKVMIVWAYAVDRAEIRCDVWNAPALKK